MSAMASPGCRRTIVTEWSLMDSTDPARTQIKCAPRVECGYSGPATFRQGERLTALREMAMPKASTRPLSARGSWTTLTRAKLVSI
jgi:hypothetical protein